MLQLIKDFFLKRNFIIEQQAVNANFTRLGFIAPVACIVSLVHIVLFYTFVKTASSNEALWRWGILVSHLSLLVMYLIVVLIFLYSRKKRVLSTRNELLVQYIHIPLIILIGITLTVFDQMVTQSIAPYIIISLAVAMSFLIRPTVALVFFSVSYVIFFSTIGITQNNAVVLVSNRVNGFSVNALSFAITCILWKYYSKNQTQKLLIEDQKIELEKNKLSLESINDELELSFYQSQINPHFIYNTLNTISYLCLEDSTRASSIVEKLAYYLRWHFDFHKFNNQVSLNEEVELIKIYIEIQKARFQERLDFQIDIDEHLYTVKVPSLILQPLVENAILHGVMKRSSGGKIILKASEDNNQIKFEVIDNGVGMTSEVIEKTLFMDTVQYTNEDVTQRRGIGLVNIRKRLHKLYCSTLVISNNEFDGVTVSFVLEKQE